MKDFFRKSFRAKLLAGFIIVSILPLTVCCVFLIQTFKAKLARDSEKQDMEISAAVEERLIGLFTAFENIGRTLTEDPQVRQSLLQTDYGKRSEIYSRLYQETEELRASAQFDLYSADGVCQYSTGSGMFHTRLPVYWGILNVAQHDSGELVIRPETDETGKKNLLRAARTIPNGKNEYAGFYVVTVTEENFSHILQGTYGSQDGICILDRFLEPVYSAGSAAAVDVGTSLRSSLLNDGHLADSLKDSRICLSRLGNTGLYTALVRLEVFTSEITSVMYRILFLMAAVCLILCILISARLSRGFSHPIQILNAAMHQVQEGNLDTRVETTRADEFGQLARNFNSMAAELKDYMERQVQQQKQLNEVQIAMMQAQLNPHFLYNTLDTMKWVAKANHIPQIAVMAAKLAKILRTGISGDQFISLHDELELVNNYIEIQRIRFNGKFSYECVFPEESAACMIPKLIVQPVVENALIHGLNDREDGHIRVEISLSGRSAADRDGTALSDPTCKAPGTAADTLSICVTDDGCGISQEVIDRLNTSDRDQLTGHIGLFNVDNIIRLHYGLQYGLKAYRRQEGGTMVVITLPAIKQLQ